MRICLVGYVDNTPENREMLETYELRNDFWAERFKFRRRDGRPVTEEELKRVSEWIDREIVRKHRTNWLSNRETAYAEVDDPAVVKKFWPWMPDDEIRERLEAEWLRRMREELPPYEWERKMMASPPADMPRQMELEFKD